MRGYILAYRPLLYASLLAMALLLFQANAELFAGYETTWTVQNEEIEGGKFRFDIYVEFTGTAADFKISDSTLRISFNRKALKNPSIMADSDDLAYTDWYIKVGPAQYRWIKHTNIDVGITAGHNETISVDTNIVSTAYKKQGYTDSLSVLTSKDGPVLHSRIEFDIIDPNKPFKLAWDKALGQEIGRKRPDENWEDISEQATFKKIPRFPPGRGLLRNLFPWL